MAFNHLQPRDDWELNCLILKICQSLDQTEFEQLKLLCSFFNHVSRRVSDTLTTPEIFFQYLKERRIIDRDNLLLLQTFLCHIGRDDLRKMAADYASQIGDTLHFITPDPEPAEGFQHIQFHVEGNLESYQRSDLESLRALMARLLFIPQENIILCGVEPGGSLTLTFMLHKNLVDSFKEVFKKHKELFGPLRVDGIGVDNSEFIDPSLNLRRRGSAPEGTATMEQLNILYQRSVVLQGLMEESEVRCLESRADATLARQEALEWRRKENYFRSLVARIGDQQKEASRKRKKWTLFKSLSTERNEGIPVGSSMKIEKEDLSVSKENVAEGEAVSRKALLRRGSVDIF